MRPTSSCTAWSWASSLILLACALAAPVAWAEPEVRPRHRWDLGLDLVGIWGGAVRAGWERDQGALDMVGLRMGWAVGPAPVFGGEHAMAGAFVAPVFDLFAEQEWQLELTAGPARVDVDHRGHAALALDEWGFVTGLAGRYKTPGWFQINLGVLMLADRRFYERMVMVDIGPSAVW